MTTLRKEITDEELIKRIVSGEKFLFERIVRKFNPYLYKVGRSYNYNHEDTQDLMQETFIDAYKALSQFEGRSSFKTWLIRIMLNNCYRKKQKLSFKNESGDEPEESSEPMFIHITNDTSKIVQNDELKKVIENALFKIPLEYRMVFSLREINGLSVAETAEAMKITESNVKVRLNRSKHMLRNQIEEVYSVGELFDFNLIYCDAIVEYVMREIDKL